MARPPHVPQPETELEEFFDLSIDPMSIIGFDGEFKRVNASFVRLLGYTKPELFSRTALDILHPDDVEPAREALAQLAEGHDLARFEARVICADGVRAVARVEHAVDARAGRPVQRRTGHNRAPARRGRVARGAALARGQSRRAARARGGAGSAAARGDAGRAGRAVGRALQCGVRRGRGARRGGRLRRRPLRDRRHGDPHGNQYRPAPRGRAPRAGSGLRRRRGPPDRAGRTTRHGRSGRLGHARGRPSGASPLRARKPDRRRGRALGRDHDRLARAPAPGRHGAPARRLHGVGGRRDRERRVPRGSRPAGRGTGRPAARRHAGRRERAVGRTVRGRRARSRHSPRRGLRRHDSLRGRRDGHLHGHLGGDGGAAADSRSFPDRAGRSDDDGCGDAPTRAGGRLDDRPGAARRLLARGARSALLGGQPDRGGGSVVGRPRRPLHGRRAPPAGHRVAHRAVHRARRHGHRQP